MRRWVSHLTLAAGFPETRVKPANTLLAMMTLPDLVVMVVRWCTCRSYELGVRSEEG